MAVGLTYEDGELKCPEGYQPTWGEMQHAIQKIAVERGHLHGYPMPLNDAKLVVSKRFPFPLLGSLGRQEDQTPEEEQDPALVNSWFSHRLWRRVFVVRGEDGKSYGEVGRAPGAWQAGRQLAVMEAVESAWLLAAEVQAMSTLAEKITPHQGACYLMTGSFLETSERSGLTYAFRRLRPTLAISRRGRRGEPGQMRVLAALCLHPLAYYEGTWGGAMVPSDDVLAHLLLMRSDEALFWRRANQHPAWAPEAGIV